jgi:hypothetical protein
VSGMLNTDAMNFVECPKCHQPAGKLCIDSRQEGVDTASGTNPGVSGQV